MIVLLIITMIILLISAITLVSGEEKVAYFLVALGSFLFSALLMRRDIQQNPQAIDVYRGKTTLEITYKDSVAIDSIVVFKNK